MSDSGWGGSPIKTHIFSQEMSEYQVRAMPTPHPLLNRAGQGLIHKGLYSSPPPYPSGRVRLCQYTSSHTSMLTQC